MNRKEFMERLEMLLNDVSDSEREEALQYYGDYFDDAGEENEESVIEELESPEKVAATIKTGLLEKEHTAGEYTERGYEDERFKRNYEVTPVEPAREGNHFSKDRSEAGREEKIVDTYKKADAGKILLIVILCLLCIPVIIPAAGVIFGALAGVAAGAAGLLIGCAALAVVCIAAGIAVFILGFTAVIGSPFGGLCLFGIGLILFGMGMLFLWITVWLCGVAVPFCVRKITGFLSNLIHRRGKKA